ncbi:MAG: NADH-quinone oxidoreductase subunit C, partial [Wenzhouxiangellaceae bacterium]
MSDFSQRNQPLVRRLRETLGDKLADIRQVRKQLVAEIAPIDWIECCRALRDTDGLEFDTMIDLCGVDFLGYGDDEWETAEATGSGYSRGVDALGPGRFDWENRPEAERIPNRFAVVVHLLSTRNN